MLISEHTAIHIHNILLTVSCTQQARTVGQFRHTLIGCISECQRLRRVQALVKEISELTVEFGERYTKHKTALLANQQQLLENTADLDRLCSLSLRGCNFGCLQNVPQLATLSSLTRLVNAHWQCVVVSVGIRC